MGGLGSGIAFDESSLRQIAGAGLRHSPTSEVLIEESILGWKEYELEVMRDKSDNVVIVCSIEILIRWVFILEIQSRLHRLLP